MWSVGAVATLLGAWQGRQTRQIKTLRDKLAAQDQRIETLATWQTTAREYIGQLLYVMAVHGVKPPRPPAELGLTVPTADDDKET